MNRRTLSTIACAIAASLMVAMAAAPPASAGGLKAQIILVQAAIPKTLTEKSLIAFARRNAMKLLHETTEADVRTRKWQGNMVVIFNAPANDMEFQVLFYDIQDGPRRFINDISMMVSDRTQKTYVQKFVLPRPAFKPNRQMEMVVTVRHSEVGRLKFGVLGQEIQRSGEVSFTDNER